MSNVIPELWVINKLCPILLKNAKQRLSSWAPRWSCLLRQMCSATWDKPLQNIRIICLMTNLFSVCTFLRNCWCVQAPSSQQKWNPWLWRPLIASSKQKAKRLYVKSRLCVGLYCAFQYLYPISLLSVQEWEEECIFFTFYLFVADVLDIQDALGVHCARPSSCSFSKTSPCTAKNFLLFTAITYP